MLKQMLMLFICSAMARSHSVAPVGPMSWPVTTSQLELHGGTGPCSPISVLFTLYPSLSMRLHVCICNKDRLLSPRRVPPGKSTGTATMSKLSKTKSGCSPRLWSSPRNPARPSPLPRPASRPPRSQNNSRTARKCSRPCTTSDPSSGPTSPAGMDSRCWPGRAASPSTPTPCCRRLRTARNPRLPPRR